METIWKENVNDGKESKGKIWEWEVSKGNY